MNRDAEFGAALLQDLEQPAPAHGRKAVSAAGDDLAPVVHVDVVPAGELALHLAINAGVSVLDTAERLVGEDNTKAERVIGRVPLPDRELGSRKQLARQRGEVQASWAATRYCDAHCAPSPGPDTHSALHRRGYAG